ncbi:ABC transporter substrate-binding protein [Natronorarus salvus]|uniref:ABC transporter substrate-binding protein n=1 Tax=Natronorarus salvus TaxID=3117733 RepID=UPI002F2624EC
MTDYRSVQNASETSRRRFLKGTGTIGAAGLMATAGCLGGNGDDDDDGEDDGGEVDADFPEEYVEEEPEGEPVSAIHEALDADFPVRHYYSEVHTNILRDIGFEMEYNVRALQAHLDETFVARNHDIMNLRWLDAFDPDRPIRDAASEAALEEGGGNNANHWNPEFEELLSEQAAAVDDDERQELVYQAQEYLVDEYVLVPILVQDRAMPYNSERVSNVHEYLEDGLAGITNMVEIETDDGELRTAQQEDLTTLDPMAAERGRADRDYGRLIFDRLMHPTPEEEFLPAPWAAESVEQPDDTTYEVTLREGLEFHDGEPVTAEDIEFTYTYGAENNAGLRGVIGNLEEVVVESDLEVTFNMSQPDATFPSRALAGRDSGILPRHILEDVDDPSGWDQDEEMFIGSGPFMLNSHDPGEELVLDAHDAHQFAPNVDRVVRVQAADAASAASAVEDETVDMVPYDLPPDQLDRLEQLDHIEISGALMTSIHYCTMNMHPDREDGPFKYYEVREAVGHTFDREEWLDVAAAGFGELLNTPMSPGLEFWVAPEDRVSPDPFDTDRAIEILGEAGFRWDQEGQLHYPADTSELTTQPDAYGWDETPEVLTQYE